jgi:SpoIIAA-like
MWQDAKIGFEHLSGWESVAVVMDLEWIEAAMRFFGFLVPGQYRCFSTRETAEARNWIAA